MGIHVADQTVDFLLSVAFGAVLGLFYDAFRILRIALPHKKAVVTFEDILFWCVSAMATFFFLLGSVNGKVRFFLLIGMVLGGVLYHFSVSSLIMGISRIIINGIKAIFIFIMRFILLPFWRISCLIISLALCPLRFTTKKIKKLLQNVKYGLKKMRILLYNHLIGQCRGKRKPDVTPGE